MSRFKLLLVALVSCSVLFIGWLLLGSYFWLHTAHAMAIMCFLLAFISVLGQFAILALTLREHSRQRAFLSSTRGSNL